MSELTELRNIGPRSAEWLVAVGVRTIDELSEIGVVEGYLRAKKAFPDQVSLNLLYGLQAAMLDIDWRQLPDDMKQDLRDQVGGVE